MSMTRHERNRQFAMTLDAFEELGVTMFDVGLGFYAPDPTNASLLVKARFVNRLAVSRKHIESRLARWLRRSNLPREVDRAKCGACIYLRPEQHGTWPVIFFDDLNRERATALADAHPALVIETSIGNYQAWVLASRPLTTRERFLAQTSSVAQLLARHGGGAADNNSTAGQKFSRPAGFTNRKPNRNADDVRVHRTPDMTKPPLPITPELLAEVLPRHPLPPLSTHGGGGRGEPPVRTTGSGGTRIRDPEQRFHHSQREFGIAIGELEVRLAAGKSDDMAKQEVMNLLHVRAAGRRGYDADRYVRATVEKALSLIRSGAVRVHRRSRSSSHVPGPADPFQL